MYFNILIIGHNEIIDWILHYFELLKALRFLDTL